jgi:hypothetical protein
MKDLKFICAQPDDAYYTWQVHLWLESLRKIGHSDKAIVLIFTPSFRPVSTKWQKIIDLYPESEFVFYKDEQNEVSQKLGIYIPVLRPFCLRNYFKEHPEMEKKAVFYCDSDVVFTDKLDVEKFLDDDVSYLSDTNSYINASYFDSKIRDVLPAKLEEYKTKDILSETCAIAGITREICEKNNLHSGGAQYLLKNIDWKFWDKMIQDTLYIRIHLMNINREFFESENKGFQSWCADMWALLWQLWERGQETKVVPEMEFSWSSDPISKLDRTAILHNAGVVADNMGTYKAFYKGKYHTGTDPLKDPHIYEVLDSEESKKFCTHHYVKQLVELKERYNLQY